MSFTERLHSAIQAEQEHMLGPATDTEEEMPESAVLTGWVLVCGWVGDDGKKWVTSSRPEGQPFWVTTGLIAEAND